MSSGRPLKNYRPQFYGKTNNIGRPTNLFGHANLFFFVVATRLRDLSAHGTGS